ncbi:hypothetical protein GH714_004118 [Hevea brasiliensis]|uniref:Uncharacterized protein n=1 Tax=Hevea brasiliensis TaxID=3981 RepID=A0A6A6KNC0_HEVBR|nr:hypothetical protein GH714_004118 [Hevea brasiliensis]
MMMESIIETNNGTVAISFARTRSRNSFSGRTVVSEPIIPRTSLSGIDLDRFSSIGIHRTEEQVAQPIYGPESTVSSPTEIVSLKRPESPTPSDMGYDKESIRTQQPKRIMALTKEESPFEKWFQTTFSLEKQQAYLKEYAKYKSKEGIKSFPEFVRFILTCKKQSYPDFEDQSFLATLESAYRNYITPKGKTLRGVHPPLTEISYKVSDNQEYECSPFSRSDKQGNYANLSLYTIGQQLSRVETQLQTFKSREYKPEKGETSKQTTEKWVLFKPMETEPSPIKLGDHSEIVNELTKRLAELGLDAKDSKRKAIAPLTKTLSFQEELEKRLKNLSIAPLSQGQEETETEDSSNTEEQINSLEAMFNQPEPLEVNRIVYPKPRATIEMKPYYSRPSPINLQFEEPGLSYAQYEDLQS